MGVNKDLDDYYSMELKRIDDLADEIARRNAEARKAKSEGVELGPGEIAIREEANSLAGTGKLKPADALKIGRIRQREKNDGPRKLNLTLKFK